MYNYINFQFCKTRITSSYIQSLKNYCKLNFHVNNPANKLPLRMW